MMMAEQFGTEMRPECFCRSPGLISGTTSGTSGRMRKAEELSIITAPAFWHASANWRERVAPRAEEGVVDAGEGLGPQAPPPGAVWPLNSTVLPAERAEAERLELGDGEFPALQRAKNLLSDRAGGPDDGDAIRVHGPDTMREIRGGSNPAALGGRVSI